MSDQGGDRVQTKASGYIPAIDGLRAIAVVSVMLFHLNNAWLPGGYCGVDVFYVISGYVVTHAVLSRPTAGLASFQLDFYARRVLRILPPLMVCLLAATLAYVLFVPRAWLSFTTNKVGIAAFFGLSNIVLATNTESYFSVRTDFNPFTHTWSLGVEEQFYLIFPPLMYFCVRAGGRDRLRRAVVALIAGICVASFVTCGVLSAKHWSYAFYMLPARLWELGAGLLLCLSIERSRTWIAELPSFAAGVGWIIATGVLITAVRTPSGPWFPFPLALAPMLGAAGLIGLVVTRPQDRVSRFLSGAVPVGVGRVSYSLYLWHWPVYVLMRWTVGLEGGLEDVAALVLTTSLALASFYWIERPVRTSSWVRRRPNGVIVASGLAVALASSAGAAAMMRLKPRLSLSQTAHRSAAWYPEVEHDTASRDGACRFSPGSSSLFGQSDFYWRTAGCARGQSRRLVAVGDSHTAAYAQMLRRVALETGLEVHVLSTGGCPLVSLIDPMKALGEPCVRLDAERMKNILAHTRSGDIIFLPGLRLRRLTDEWGPVVDHTAPAQAAQAQARGAIEGEAAVDRLTAHGLRVIFEAPKPIFPSPPFRCADWFNAHNPVCAGGFAMSRRDIERRRSKVLATMMALAQRSPQVEVWDPLPVLCPAATCHAFSGDEPIYFDGDHLSGRGNLLLVPSFVAQLLRGERLRV